MAHTPQDIKTLLHWAREQQTCLHESVEIYVDSITGLSFRATKDILPASKIVTCSYRTTLSYLNAIEVSLPDFPRHNSVPLPTTFINCLRQENPNIIGHFFLMQQYLMGPDSFWWDYIRLLPQPDDPKSLAIPIWWPEDDRKFLDGTNAEPPIKKRISLWKTEWDGGIDLLRETLEDWEKYTYPLYQWAATIYGSRSFRASLTIPKEVVQDFLSVRDDLALNFDHIEKDRFSVLLPVVDIGNHNGINEMDWSQDPNEGAFNLSNRALILTGSQIYNYYGNKSNSELLVGYGFLLPNAAADLVNLKVTPGPEALKLRRSQVSHVVMSGDQPEQEFMFHVRLLIEAPAQTGMKEFQVFSPGLIDTMSCLVANARERMFIERNPDYSLERDTDPFSGSLSRNLLRVLSLLYRKLELELQRVLECGPSFRKPQNQNQRTASEYRERQLTVLRQALPQLSTRLRSVASYNSFCKHVDHPLIKGTAGNMAPLHRNTELLSLECAFNWLFHSYPNIHSNLEQSIANDQEEDTPLNWAVLVEDWDHTYWVVWIYVVCTLWIRDGPKFASYHKALSLWITYMNQCYNQLRSSGTITNTLYAESSEQESIDSVIGNYSGKPGFVIITPAESENLRNFASFIAHEETMPAPYVMAEGPQKGEVAEHKMLCITKVAKGTASGEKLYAKFLEEKPEFIG